MFPIITHFCLGRPGWPRTGHSAGPGRNRKGASLGPSSSSSPPENWVCSVSRLSGSRAATGAQGRRSLRNGAEEDRQTDCSARCREPCVHPTAGVCRRRRCPDNPPCPRASSPCPNRTPRRQGEGCPLLTDQRPVRTREPAPLKTRITGSPRRCALPTSPLGPRWKAHALEVRATCPVRSGSIRTPALCPAGFWAERKPRSLPDWNFRLYGTSWGSPSVFISAVCRADGVFCKGPRRPPHRSPSGSPAREHGKRSPTWKSYLL